MSFRIIWKVPFSTKIIKITTSFFQSLTTSLKTYWLHPQPIYFQKTPTRAGLNEYNHDALCMRKTCYRSNTIIL